MRRNTCTLLTPPGVAAIAVVRLCGPGIEAFFARHFSAALRPGRCVHGQLSDIDDPVIVLHADRLAADVNLHGGTWIVHRFMELAAAEGFAASGNLPGDGDTVLAREIWASLPAARTELALRTLLAQESVWHDFIGRSPGRSALQSVLRDKALYWLLALPTVAIIGRANAGKSTLANQLFGQARAIVADLPGTTRDWVGEIADVDGLAVMLVDTPGLRDSTDAIEQAAIATSRGPAKSAALRLLVLDPTQPDELQQRALLAKFPDAIPIVNKSDRSAAWDAAEIPGALSTIATTGQGLEQVRAAILRHFGCERLESDRPRCWTDRHRQLLARAMDDPSALASMIDG